MGYFKQGSIPFTNKGSDTATRFVKTKRVQALVTKRNKLLLGLIGVAFYIGSFVNLFLTSMDQQATTPSGMVRPPPPYPGKERLVKMLKVAGIDDIDSDNLKLLPTWETVRSLYGEGPRIYGLDQCQVYREQVPDPTERFMGPAGTFNTGTNLLHSLLQINCFLPEKIKRYGLEKGGIKKQVPWGKHNPPNNETFRLTNKGKHVEEVDAKMFLPVVTIRDPYFWMISMCSNPYAVSWRNMKTSHCPILINNQDDVKRSPILRLNVSGRNLQSPKNKWIQRYKHNKHVMAQFPIQTPDNGPVKVIVQYSNTWHQQYDSLLHLWNEYYDFYYRNASFPRIMIRMEDLIFHAEETISTLCTCVGGTMNETQDHFQFIPESAKHSRNHSSTTGLLDAMILYGNHTARYSGYSEQDLDFVNKSINRDLMNVFGYSYYISPTTASDKN